jgi:hypothetical protein
MGQAIEKGGGARRRDVLRLLEERTFTKDQVAA